MSAIRTQIYLTSGLRARVDEYMRREQKSLAEVVRDALDEYLNAHERNPQAALDATFGSIPHLEVPSRDEWERYAVPR